jgi:hypothetical protein
MQSSAEPSPMMRRESHTYIRKYRYRYGNGTGCGYKCCYVAWTLFLSQMPLREQNYRTNAWLVPVRKHGIRSAARLFYVVYDTPHAITPQYGYLYYRLLTVILEVRTTQYMISSSSVPWASLFSNTFGSWMLDCELGGKGHCFFTR